MINKLFLILFLTNSIVLSLTAQTNVTLYKIGSFVDHTNQPIDNYIDFTYAPKNKITCALTIGEDFTTGFYYNSINNKITGQIKYNQATNTIKFRTSENQDAIKIRPENCRGYVIGSDSFAVIRNFNVERVIGGIHNSEPDFAEVIAVIGDLTFYKHIRIGQNNIVYTYMTRRGSDGILVSFPQSFTKFNAIAFNYFGHIPYLRSKLQKEEYSSDDLPFLIKQLENYTRYKQNEKIFFTYSNEETTKISDASYFGKIIKSNNSKWTFNYFTLDSTLLYEGNYDSLATMRKDGMFTFYYPNGTIRKKVNYTNNVPDDSITEYHPNGVLHYEYTQLKGQKRQFTRVVDINGKELLNASGKGIEVFYDSILNREITRIFQGHKIKTAYFISVNGAKVYQACQRAGKEAISSQGYIENSYLKYPSSSIARNSQGLVLVKMHVDQTGETTAMHLIKGLDNSIDQEVLSYCRNHYKGKAWVPAKVSKLPVEQEVIVGFLFTLNGFTRSNNNGMQQQMMMQNQMRMQQQMMMPKFTAPRF